jgi:hypothetical protein
MPDFGIMRGFNDKLFGDKLVAGQLPTQLGLIGSQEVFDIDPDAQAFFDRVTAAGGTLSATEKTAVDTLVKQMKLDGTWTPMKAIYPMVGASAAACAQNLKSASFTGTFTSGWTFASTGVTPNGTSAYMDTNLTPNGTISQNSASVSVYSRTNNTGLSSRIELGSSNATVDFQESIRWDGSLGNLSRLNNGYIVGTSGYVATKTSGFFLTSRTASTTTKKFEDGTLKETTADTSATPNSVKVYLAARNNSGVAAFYDVKQYAFASIGDGLTDTQAGNFYTAVQAFQTTLSRQV